jgi:hypothetical protein
MNLAVSFYQADPSGIPDGWPKQARQLGDATGPLNAGEQLMTPAELDVYKAARQSAYDTWRNSKLLAEATRIQTNIDALRALFDDFQIAEDTWGALTALQIQTLVRKHNQALLRLRPLFSALYRREVETNA